MQLIVYFSFTGNNRLLAEHLAPRIGADLCAVVEKKRRTALTVLLDMAARASHEGARQAASAGASRYSFISLCGYERPGQHESLARELSSLVGRAPTAVAQLRLADLFPAHEKKDVRAVSGYRAKAEDLRAFAPAIEDFLARVTRGNDGER